MERILRFKIGCDMTPNLAQQPFSKTDS
jgi:hypothetical protein